MINNSTLESIRWYEDRKCIVINPDLYPNEAGEYFRSKKIASLVRQLFHHGFKKKIITKVNSDPEYCHEHFTRDRRDDMSLIRPKLRSKVALTLV